MNRAFKAGLAALATLALVQDASAGLFTVTPVRIYMTPKDRAIAVTITNDGDEELVMQADVYTWKQKPGGEDELVLSEDLILSPPILKLAPKARQVVRLARLVPPSPIGQQTYRLIIREIPEAKPAQNVQLQVALAFSLPVFLTGAQAQRELSCGGERSGIDSLKVVCENTGTAYAQPRELVLSTAAGDKLATRDSALYLLPGVKRSFDLKRTEGRIPAGKLKLAVTQDDGSTQDFDLTVAE